MNIIQLKYFSAVCTFHSVSDAAAYLHISQPSLSNSIKELEKEFGVSLFRRHHRGMTLTPEGEVLYKMSEDILSRTEQAENIMKDLGGERKTLRLGVPPMIGSLILPGIYRDFVSRDSDIRLDIMEGGRQDLVQKLNEDYVDMVFLPHDAPLDRSFAALHAARMQIVCCAAKSNPVSGLRSVRPSDFEGRSIVLFENSFFQTEKIKKWFAECNVSPDIILQTKQLSTMLSMISNDVAAGFMFRPLIESSSNLVAIPMEAPMFVDVSLVWKRDAYLFSCMKKFKEYVNHNNLTCY